ncbi:hypothetical protein AB0M58_39820, partial [Streptomyces bobili]
MNGWAVVVAGAVVVGYGALSRRLSTTVLSGPLVFMLVGVAIGPLGLDLLDRAKDPEVTRTLLESALVGLGQVCIGAGMSRWQVGQAPVQRARSVCSS